MLRKGYVINDTYRVEGLLGTGGMATVYEVTQIRFGKKMAMKLIHPVFAAHENYRERFLAEAHLLGTLNHPNIINVTDVHITAEGTPYMVMELLRGRTLGRFLQEKGPLPLEVALSLVRQVAHALHAAHRHEPPVVHRDLTPANIFLCDHGEDSFFVKVLDFGIAKWHHPEKGVRTEGPVAMGTPPYMSPEQIAAENVDERTDQFALAAILYEMVSGRMAFMREGDTADKMRHRVCHEEPPLLESYAVEPVVRRALSKRREDRYATVAEFMAALGIPITGRGLTGLVMLPVGASVQSGGLGAPGPVSSAPPLTPPISAPSSPPPEDTHRMALMDIADLMGSGGGDAVQAGRIEAPVAASGGEGAGAGAAGGDSGGFLDDMDAAMRDTIVSPDGAIRGRLLPPPMPPSVEAPSQEPPPKKPTPPNEGADSLSWFYKVAMVAAMILLCGGVAMLIKRWLLQTPQGGPLDAMSIGAFDLSPGVDLMPSVDLLPAMDLLSPPDLLPPKDLSPAPDLRPKSSHHHQTCTLQLAVQGTDGQVFKDCMVYLRLGEKYQLDATYIHNLHVYQFTGSGMPGASLEAHKKFANCMELKLAKKGRGLPSKFKVTSACAK
jgi:serine/threonine-protein kinase